jgi:hypothetical protein
VLVKSLREEGEKAHSSLFELATQHEQAEGNRQREVGLLLLLTYFGYNNLLGN